MLKTITKNFFLNVNNSTHAVHDISLRKYATHRVHTPKPTSTSQEGLTNNPPFCLHRQNGSIVGQHSEWSLQICKESECIDYICPS